MMKTISMRNGDWPVGSRRHGLKTCVDRCGGGFEFSATALHWPSSV
jgi:hypothetical protein